MIATAPRYASVAEYLAANPLLPLYSARAEADALISPVALGPQHWVTLLSGEGTQVALYDGMVCDIRDWETQGTDESGASFDNLEITVTRAHDCYCGRPCCSGTYSTGYTIGWDSIVALHAADGTLLYGEEYCPW